MAAGDLRVRGHLPPCPEDKVDAITDLMGFCFLTKGKSYAFPVHFPGPCEAGLSSLLDGDFMYHFLSE